jgi:hypothetical protein
VSETGQSSLWKAFDEMLERAVAVRTFGPGRPGSGPVIAAARAASRVTDHRLARVYDANDDACGAYIVTEWPRGVHLDDLLAAGQLDVAAALVIAAEAASALAAAHDAGIAHQCLTPRALAWAPDAGLKITGLGVDAALAGAPLAASGATALADTRALARLLYAALTGYWPGTSGPALPAAPMHDGQPYRPRQVRAGVPASVDEITWRALLPPRPPDGPAITTPAQLAGQLSELLGQVARREPPRARPAAAEMATVVAGAPPGAAANFGPHIAARPPPRQYAGRRRALAAGGVIGALFVIDSALISAGVIGTQHGARTAGALDVLPPVWAPRRRVARSLDPVSARSFDPYGDTAGDENNSLAPAAIDGQPATYWHTFWYLTDRFGNLKPGTGLLLDMGATVTVTAVTVQLGVAAGAEVALRIGALPAPHALAVAARANGMGGQVALRPTTHRRGRYVLVWFTRLPRSAGRPGMFQADVHNVAVRGF